MTSPAESFVITLARASKRARRLLRGFSGADIEDILATAMLWCWENRAGYNLEVPLDKWFFGAVRNAKKAWLNGETTTWTDISRKMAAPDNTAADGEAAQAMEELNKALSKGERRVVTLLAEGYTVEEIGERLKISQRRVKQRLRVIRRYSYLMPRPRVGNRGVRTAHKFDSDDGSFKQQPQIDKELTFMLNPPRGRKARPKRKRSEDWGNWLYLTDGALPTVESLTAHLARVENLWRHI